MAPRLRRCLYCGGAPIETEALRERHLECPGCRGAMSELPQGDLLIDRCGACGGVWYDRGELEQAIQIEKAKKQELWDHLPPTARAETAVVYRSCPLCRQSMHRKRRGPVVIDLCGSHGAFLDAGELERIARWVEPPPEEHGSPRDAKLVPYDRDPDAFAEAATGAIAIDLAAEAISWVFFDW